MPLDERRLRWEARYAQTSAPARRPASVLRRAAFLLPPKGDALDLACGLGGNALFLAQRGLRVTAWDYAPSAIVELGKAADRAGLSIRAEVRDVVAQPPMPASFDVICVSYFLQRELAPALSAALRPGGLIFYETFAREAVSTQGPANPAYRLAPNELLELFSDLRVLEYREYGRVGDPARGARDSASLVAQKAAS